MILQKITSGPFADPYRHLLQHQQYDAKINNSNKNRNHILSTVNNGGASGGKNCNQTENNYNNHSGNCKPPAPPPHYSPRRPSLTAALVGGGVGADVVDNSNCLPSPRSSQDMHTPSESNSESMSSSEQSSSSGEEWESGELSEPNTINNLALQQDIIKTTNTVECEPSAATAAAVAVAASAPTVVSGKKHHTTDDDHNPYYSDDNYYYGSSLTGGTRILSQRKKFKAKITSPNPIIEQKMRWLANMRSDPDFAETLNRNVQFRSPSSNDSLNTDYYSSICDKQLSFGSPSKSPGELIRMAAVAEGITECEDIVVVPKTPLTPTGFTPKLVEGEPCKSPSKTDIFKSRFFSFARRENAPAPTDKSEPSSPIPLITVDDSHCDSKTAAAAGGPRFNRCSPFSFREIRQEIQSVIRHSTSATSAKLKEKK